MTPFFYDKYNIKIEVKMSAIDDTPKNLNFLSPLNFKFTLHRAPTLNFFVQKVTFPGVSLEAIEVPNPLVRVPYAGDHLQYDELDLTFKVDEDLQNYLEVHNWVRSLGKLNYKEYANISSQPLGSDKGIRSDITLGILNSMRRPNYEIVFKDAFPIKVSSLEFDTTDEDVTFISATCQFRYISFDINKIT